LHYDIINAAILIAFALDILKSENNLNCMCIRAVMAHKIVSDRKICGGKACIEGTRIRVIDIIEKYKILKEKPEEIAAAFDIPIDAVFSALAYYYEHAAEMKKEIDSDKELVKKIKSELKSVAYAA
jgi:uncharacterized protein (DUF433 family)